MTMIQTYIFFSYTAAASSDRLSKTLYILLFVSSRIANNNNNNRKLTINVKSVNENLKILITMQKKYINPRCS